jgi:hypothetical protein
MTNEERERDTIPPDTDQMAPLTEARFKAILHEVVGEKILEIYELVKKIPRIQETQDDHEARLRKLERQVDRLAERLGE